MIFLKELKDISFLFPIIVVLITAMVGYLTKYYFLKSNFFLKYFNLHEKVLKKLIFISNNEIEGFYFKKTKQEIGKMLKDKKIMTAGEYFYFIKKYDYLWDVNNEFLPNIVFDSFEKMVKDLDDLSIRSNEKISKTINRVLKIYNDEINNLNFYFDNIDLDYDNNISKKDNNYLNYLKNETEEKILFKIVPLLNSLKIELKTYLKNKK